ncbi:hypothetical protein ACFQ1M_13650 [Sungkyunkwania multivorans]|uniref:Uncharacterized protein n=1 Tax=Sungkyunkwania multivorans TaxID=1173618 RepID=A0ABW3D342_9FLAO
MNYIKKTITILLLANFFACKAQINSNINGQTYSFDTIRLENVRLGGELLNNITVSGLQSLIGEPNTVSTYYEEDFGFDVTVVKYSNAVFEFNENEQLIAFRNSSSEIPITINGVDYYVNGAFESLQASYPSSYQNRMLGGIVMFIEHNNAGTYIVSDDTIDFKVNTQMNKITSINMYFK